MGLFSTLIAFFFGGIAALISIAIGAVIYLAYRTQRVENVAHKTTYPAFAAILKEKKRPFSPITPETEEFSKSYFSKITKDHAVSDSKDFIKEKERIRKEAEKQEKREKKDKEKVERKLLERKKKEEKKEGKKDKKR